MMRNLVSTFALEHKASATSPTTPATPSARRAESDANEYRLMVVTSRRPLYLAGDELLPAVNVVRRASERRVAHDVYGERGDVGRFDDAPDGKRGAKVIAAVFKFIAEERCRQRCVNEASGDEVDSDGREFERQVGGEGG